MVDFESSGDADKPMKQLTSVHRETQHNGIASLVSD